MSTKVQQLIWVGRDSFGACANANLIGRKQIPNQKENNTKRHMIIPQRKRMQSTTYAFALERWRLRRLL